MIQVQFINKMLQTGDASCISKHNLTEDFFPLCKDEFNFIKNHFNLYGTAPDRESFFAKFQEFRILDVNESFDFLLKELFDDRKSRIIARSFNTVKEKIQANKVDDAVAEIYKTNEALTISSSLEADDFFETALARYDAYVDKSLSFDNYYVKTGLPELDEIIGGWERANELVTIVARTNVGKSWILIKSATEAIKQGLRVGIYEGEMTTDKVAYRMDTFIGHVSNSGITHGDIKVQNEYKQYIETLRSEFPNGYCKILTPERLGGLATVSQLRGFIEKYQLDILFVDQHSLLEDERKGHTPIEKASNISKDLKALQVLKKIPIITVSQQNRSAADDGVGTEHIAQSDRIGQDSTIILGVEKNKDQSMLIITLVKSRDSGKGQKLKYIHNFDKGTFQYVPEEQYDGDNFDKERTEHLKDEYVITPDEISPF